MQLFQDLRFRLRAAREAFRHPADYRKARDMENFVRQLRPGQIGILRDNPDTEYEVHVIGYPESLQVCQFIGLAPR